MIYENIPLKGLRFADIDLQERIGGGGSAVVYRGIQNSLAPLTRNVAVKIFLAPLEDREATNHKFEQCRRDVQALIELSNHPAILPYISTHIIDVVLDASGHATAGAHPPQTTDLALIAFCIVTEYADGGALGSEYKQEVIDSMNRNAFIGHFIDICDGLKTAHAKNIIHRDIKPANIFWFKEHNKVKLGDFGIAKLADAAVGSPAYLNGSLPYMSPESFDSLTPSTDARDIYALGCTFYELLTGSPPFVPNRPLSGLNTAEVVAIYRQLHKESPRPDAIGQAKELVSFKINHLLKQMMDTQSGSRPSIDHVMTELEKWRSADNKASSLSEEAASRTPHVRQHRMGSLNLVNPLFRSLIGDRLYFILLNLPNRGNRRINTLLNLLDYHFGTSYSFFEVFGRNDFVIRVWSNQSEIRLKKFCESVIERVLDEEPDNLRILGCDKADYLSAKSANWKKFSPEFDVVQALAKVYEAQVDGSKGSLDYLQNAGIYIRSVPSLKADSDIKAMTLIEGTNEMNETDAKQQFETITQVIKNTKSLRGFRIACYRRVHQRVYGLYNYPLCHVIVTYVVKKFSDVAKIPEVILDKLPNQTLRTSTFLATGRYFVFSDGVLFEE